MGVILDALTHVVVSLPTWELIRAFGLTAYLLLFFTTALGMFLPLQLISGSTKAVLTIAHRLAGWLALIFALVHGLLLMIDRTMPFTWTLVFFPSWTNVREFSFALGVITLYLLLIVLLSTDLIALLGKKLWKKIHFLSYGAFVLAFMHGVWAGTDASTLWGTALYASTGGIVFVLTVLHILLRRKPIKNKQPSVKQTI